MRVLVAENHPATALFVRKGLEAEFYAVSVTADGAQARAMELSWITTSWFWN